MHLTVITPVGPGHEFIVGRAIHSVSEATKRPGRFTGVAHSVIFDVEGRMGRGRARNRGMTDGWMFFLDADDVMMPDALELNDFSSPATFGAVCLDGVVTDNNIWPCDWQSIRKYGARGTLSMGFFYKGSLRWHENMDAGEDFDFYMRLSSWKKVERPLVSIGRSIPSAGGPRGYERLDWHRECQNVIDRYV